MPKASSTKRKIELPAATAASTVEDMWVGDLFGELWLRSKDGELVCVPIERQGALRKLLRKERR